MGTRLSSPTIIEVVQLSELRVKLTSTMPQCTARVVLLDGSGMHVADTVFGNFSNETWSKLKELESSIEEDFLNKLQTSPGEQTLSPDGERDEPQSFNWDGRS
jgi:hypothetical protein